MEWIYSSYNKVQIKEQTFTRKGTIQLARQNIIFMNNLKVGKREESKKRQGEEDVGTNGKKKSVHKEKEQKGVN